MSGNNHKIDCILIGYNDIPLREYISLLSSYGSDSMAYRDLKLSFVDLPGRPATYVELMNLCAEMAGRGGSPAANFKSGEIPNLAAVYLLNFMRKQGFTAEYINLFQEEKSRLAALLQAQPICVAITTTFYVLNFPVNEIVKFIRSCNPTVKIIAGGPLVVNHVRNLRDDNLSAALKDMNADFYVIDAQGESTLSALVKALKAGEDPANVPNLMYFAGGQFVQTRTLPETNSMDEVDISWDDVAQSSALGPTLQLRTARSCAFKCSFCNYPTRAGKLSLANLETVERELESIHRIGNVKNIVFIDDTFNVPLPRFKDLCRKMIEKRYDFHWYSYFRCSNSDEEAIELMARSGCKGVFLGIESGSPAILKGMNKAASIGAYADGIRLLKQHGIITFGSFIVGFPGETDETVRETVDFIRHNKPDFYRAQLWYCEPGTPIYQEREKYGIAGQGFKWQHATMVAPSAMAHIEAMFLGIRESIWLPQWSFDFWFIPYAMGKGLSMEQFKEFVVTANEILKLEISHTQVTERAKKMSLKKMVNQAGAWQFGV
jgi:radical SAM PhpK family P-methyltransferase